MAACMPGVSRIAGYVVGGASVADHNNIDLDQKEMEDALKANDYTLATKWYPQAGRDTAPALGNGRAPRSFLPA